MTVPVDAVESRVGIAEHLRVADHVAEAAATLVRDPRRILPLGPGPVAVIGAAEIGETATWLVRAFHTEGRDAAVVPAGRLDAAAGDAAFAVVMNGRAAGDAEASAGMIRVIKAALSRGPTVVVSVGVPYVLAVVPEGAACVAVFGADPASVHAAARVLTGALRPRGHLPVSLPSA